MRIHYSAMIGSPECGIGRKLTRVWNNVTCRRCWHMPEYLKVATGREDNHESLSS